MIEFGDPFFTDIWFAWYPVKTIEGERVWLINVYRFLDSKSNYIYTKI